MNIQFEHEKEIINAILDETGLFCGECEWLSDWFADCPKKALWASRFACKEKHLRGHLGNYHGKPVAYISCQVEAQKEKVRRVGEK